MDFGLDGNSDFGLDENPAADLAEAGGLGPTMDFLLTTDFLLATDDLGLSFLTGGGGFRVRNRHSTKDRPAQGSSPMKAHSTPSLYASRTNAWMSVARSDICWVVCISAVEKPKPFSLKVLLTVVLRIE